MMAFYLNNKDGYGEVIAYYGQSFWGRVARYLVVGCSRECLRMVLKKCLVILSTGQLLAVTKHQTSLNPRLLWGRATSGGQLQDWLNASPTPLKTTSLLGSIGVG